MRDKHYSISRREFMRGVAAGLTAVVALPPVQAASIAATPTVQKPSEFMALFDGEDGWRGPLTMAIGNPNADPRILAENLLEEVLEDDPMGILPDALLIEYPIGTQGETWGEMPEENREAAIEYLAAQFRHGWGRWDCESRDQDYPEDCAICTQCATGNDLICGGDARENTPFFSTCRADAPGAEPYLIWERE